jgi:hypothetical protein
LRSNPKRPEEERPVHTKGKKKQAEDGEETSRKNRRCQEVLKLPNQARTNSYSEEIGSEPGERRLMQ